MSRLSSIIVGFGLILFIGWVISESISAAKGNTKFFIVFLGGSVLMSLLGHGWGIGHHFLRRGVLDEK